MDGADGDHSDQNQYDVSLIESPLSISVDGNKPVGERATVGLQYLEKYVDFALGMNYDEIDPSDLYVEENNAAERNGTEEFISISPPNIDVSRIHRDTHHFDEIESGKLVQKPMTRPSFKGRSYRSSSKKELSSEQGIHQASGFRYDVDFIKESVPQAIDVQFKKKFSQSEKDSENKYSHSMSKGSDRDNRLYSASLINSGSSSLPSSKSQELNATKDYVLSLQNRDQLEQSTLTFSLAAPNNVIQSTYDDPLSKDESEVSSYSHSETEDSLR